MIKIKSNEFILNLDKLPMKFDDRDLLFVRAFAIVLTASRDSKDPLRAYALAQKLLSNEGQETEVELDLSEVEFIRESVKNFKDGFVTLVNAQLLEKLQG